VKSFLAATAFLTRLPVGRLAAFDAADVAHSAGWFPLIGVLLGIVYSLAAALLKNYLPLEVVAVLLVILDALATGALHYDGLADTADGFGGGKNREDILRIMRDHAIGSYGGMALATLVALKVTANAALLTRSNWIAALILTPALGRWSILLLTATLPYARPSASAIEGMGKRSLLWGTGVVLAAMIVATIATTSARAWIAMAAVCESAALLTFIWAGYPR
jgi:adenosylcobinamide-GDP ribazoletransferase